jgi:flagellar hook protein FlgE
MGLYGLLRTSASGMQVQADRLSAVSDNIANVSTHGYKEASTEFATFVLDSGASEYQSGSVQTNVRYATSAQMGFDYTSRPTDLAVQGQGYFVASDPSGQPLLTRAGSFVKNGNGALVNAAGLTLMGFPASGASPVANGFGGLQPVNLSTLALKASPTTKGSLTLNLPSNAATVTVPAPPAPSTLPSANTSAATPTVKTSLATYDNLGNQVTLDLYMTKTGTNTWEAAVFNQANAASATAAFPYTSGPLTTAALSFDPTTGALATASAKSLSLTIPNGAAAVIDLSKTTQLATDYTVLSAEANGNAPSQVDKVQIGKDGILSAVYQNGSTVQAYRIPLATVTSPDNLVPVAGNAYTAGPDSGAVLIGTAGSGSFGTVVSGALEKSTVDIATQLTTMIESQRNYTANSKVFQTGTELLDTLVNLSR